MELNKPYFIEDDCFRQVSKPDSKNYCIFEWKQLARFYFYQFYFKHDYDVTYFARTSAVKFLVEGQPVTLQRGANLTIPAGIKYTFRGIEHCPNELIAMGDAGLRDSWESAARSTLHAEKLGVTHPRVS